MSLRFWQASLPVYYQGVQHDQRDPLEDQRYVKGMESEEGANILGGLCTNVSQPHLVGVELNLPTRGGSNDEKILRGIRPSGRPQIAINIISLG